jgi:hypothetical protein
MTVPDPMRAPAIRAEYLAFQRERVLRAVVTSNPYLLAKVLRQLTNDGFRDLANQISDVILTAALRRTLSDKDVQLIRALFPDAPYFPETAIDGEDHDV